MQQQIAMVTGATAGIGKETARGLAQQGMTVIVVGRNAEKTARVAAEIRATTGNPDVEPMLADCASLAQVRALADAFKARYDRLDVLVNNAGIVTQTRQVSVDGYELMFAVNYLAPFLLTNLLLDVLKASAPARIGLVFAPEQKAPRVVFVSQSEVVAVALEFASRLHLNGERPILSTLSPASLAGLATGPVAALLVGAPLAWFGPFEAQSFIETLDKAGPCHLVAPEAIAADLAAAGLIAPGRLESLSLTTRDFVATPPTLGAACPVALLTSDGEGRMTISLAGA